MDNRAQNKLEYHQILFSYALENAAKRNAEKRAGSRKARDGLFARATRTRAETSTGRRKVTKINFVMYS